MIIVTRSGKSRHFSHKAKYLEIRNLIIQWIISQDCIELLTRNSNRSTVINGISVYELFNE